MAKSFLFFLKKYSVRVKSDDGFEALLGVDSYGVTIEEVIELVLNQGLLPSLKLAKKSEISVHLIGYI